MTSRARTHGADMWARRIALASIFSCVVILVTTGLAAGGILPGRAAATLPSSGYVVGSHIDLPAGWYGSTRRNVFLFARTDCAVTARAAGFLGQVRSRFSSGAVAVRLVVPGERPEAEVQFAKDAGFAEAQVMVARFSDLSLTAVPSIVVSDDAGTVLWQGIASTDPGRQAELIAELSRVIGD